MKKRIVFVLAVILVFASCEIIPTENFFYEAKITAVIDGDTVEIQFIENPPVDCKWNERVRLIGVDTPELFKNPPEYFAQEAKNYTNEYYLANVLFEFDTVSAKRDKYDRLLGFVYVDGVYVDGSLYSLNEQLIEKGMGYYYGVFSF
ncbi:MAG TPA: hypothetical protein DDW88_04410, partial [Treponema sp.]|nr:hypothetical protein [Treponema sp.]